MLIEFEIINIIFSYFFSHYGGSESFETIHPNHSVKSNFSIQMQYKDIHEKDRRNSKYEYS